MDRQADVLVWRRQDHLRFRSPNLAPKWALDAFWDFEIPQDLVEGYGYPQLTEQAKRKILGENLLGSPAWTPRRRARG